MSEQRAHQRILISGAVNLYWEDERRVAHFCRAEARDVSHAGLSVKIRERIPLRILVQVECVANKVKGTASVRHCVQRGLDYRVGLEFMSGTQAANKMRYD